MYFHSSTLIRRRSNAVNFLKTSNGAWVSDITEIGGNFVSHFSNLFSSTTPPIYEDMLSLFEPMISAEDNSYLCAIPTDDEVVQALSKFMFNQSSRPGWVHCLFH
jgi:hypothetical protein